MYDGLARLVLDTQIQLQLKTHVLQSSEKQPSDSVYLIEQTATVIQIAA